MVGPKVEEIFAENIKETCKKLNGFITIQHLSSFSFAPSGA